MTYFDQKHSSYPQNYLIELQSDNRAFESQKNILFKESSSEIHYLIRQLNKLVGVFDQKNVDFESLGKESCNWTASTQKSKVNVFRTTKITLKRQNQSGYSDETLRQKLDQLIQRQIFLEQKIQLFIKKNCERKQKYQQLLQRQNQLKQRDELIQQLKRRLQLQKQKYKTQLEAQINQSSKLQKNKLQSQYNKKISHLKQQYDEKTLQNIQKYESIVQLLQKEKDKVFSMMEEEISNMETNYEHQLKEKRLKSPQKNRKIISPQYREKHQKTTGQKTHSESQEKFCPENQQKTNKPNQRIVQLQYILLKHETQSQKLKEQSQKLKEQSQKLKEQSQKLKEQSQTLREQNAKLITRIQCYGIKNKQQVNRIREKDDFITQKSLELIRSTRELQEKNEICVKLQKSVRSLQAKLANITQELKRSKKANDQIRQLSNRNIKNMQKQLDDSRRQLAQSKKTYLTLNSQLDTFKHEIKQKQIRIQSMDRQLQRTKNYNQILTKTNFTLNQTIEGIGKNQGQSNLLKIPQLFKQSLKQLPSPRNSLQNKSPIINLSHHSQSLQYIHQLEAQADHLNGHHSQAKSRIKTSMFNRFSEQSITQDHRQNSLGRSLILPLIDLKDSVNNQKQLSPRNINQSNVLFNYNSFETTFSPFISPNLPQQSTSQNSMAQPQPTNILSWNPQSPINQMQSLYDSLNDRNPQNRQSHSFRSDQLIEKMNSLSKQKNRRQKSLLNSTTYGLSSLEFAKSKQKQSQTQTEPQIKVPKLKPLSRFGYQGTKDGKQPTSPSQDRVLNLSFEENSFYNRSAFFNKKIITSSGKLETYKGGLREFK